MARRNEWFYATDAQMSYLRRLLDEAAPLRCTPYVIDTRRDWLKSEASKAIDDLKQAIAAAKSLRS